MTVLLFQPRFVAPIQAGTKRQTIRPPRKRPIRVDDNLSLRYWEDKPYRSPQIEFATKRCAVTVRVRIGEKGIWLCPFEIQGEWWKRVRDLEKFARADGFDSWEEMREFVRSRFGYGLPFEGVLIGWEKPAHG